VWDHSLANLPFIRFAFHLAPLLLISGRCWLILMIASLLLLLHHGAAECSWRIEVTVALPVHVSAAVLFSAYDVSVTYSA
jgi:hypothetical protein